MKSGWTASMLSLALAACVSPGIRSDEVVAVEAIAPRDELDILIDACEMRFARAAWNSSGDSKRLETSLQASDALTAAIGRADEVQRWVAFARWADRARVSAASNALDRSPGALEKRGVAPQLATRIERLDFIEIAAHARLGFESSVEELCASRPELLEFAEVERRLAGAALPARIEAWTLVGLFRVARARDAGLALRFAALAFDRGAAFPDDFGELESWLERDASAEFRCPKCDHPLMARLRACPNDQTPNGEFSMRPRDAATISRRVETRDPLQ